MPRLYTNTASFYVRGLSIHDFGICWALGGFSWTPPPIPWETTFNSRCSTQPVTYCVTRPKLVLGIPAFHVYAIVISETKEKLSVSFWNSQLKLTVRVWVESAPQNKSKKTQKAKQKKKKKNYNNNQNKQQAKPKTKTTAKQLIIKSLVPSCWCYSGRFREF